MKRRHVKRSIAGFWSTFIACAILFAGFAMPAYAVTPQISAGFYHTVALKSDGTVWAWGAIGGKMMGEIGTTPVQIVFNNISSVRDIIAVSAGEFHTVALKSDGTVWAWGKNNNGQLGNNGHVDSGIPVKVDIPGSEKIIAIAAGGSHTMALTENGDLWSWGRDDYGQLGNGDTDDSFTMEKNRQGVDQKIYFSHTPAQIDLSGVIAISVGDEHSVALMNNGTVMAWGRNDHGELGNGGVVKQSTPQNVMGLSGKSVTAVSAGHHHTLALDSYGKVWSWGKNQDGQLGYGTSPASYSAQPKPVVFPDDIKITAVAGGEEHSLAVDSNGGVWAWGCDEYGQLGDGKHTIDGTTTNNDTHIPTLVTNVSGIVAIAAGEWHSVALMNDGTIKAWGNSDFGQLGNGSITVKTEKPMRIMGMTDVKAIAAGDNYSFALKNDGTVWGLGTNDLGQMGGGVPVAVNGAPVAPQVTPVQVPFPAEVSIKYITDSWAVDTDGAVWTWGNSFYRKAGENRTNAWDHKPQKIEKGLTGIKEVASSSQGLLALDNLGHVWEVYAPDNSTDMIISNAPTKGATGEDLSGITEVSASNGNLALDSAGNVWGWGMFNAGPAVCSDISPTYCITPDWIFPAEPLSGLFGTKAIRNSYYRRFVVDQDGFVWYWGDFVFNPGTTTRSFDKKKIVGLSNITAITDSRALDKDGQVWSWNWQPYPSLGDIAQESTAISSCKTYPSAYGEYTICTPTSVMIHPATRVMALNDEMQNVTALAQGIAHTWALDKSGQVWGWGDNKKGQLGASQDWDPHQIITVNLGATSPAPAPPTSGYTLTYVDNSPNGSITGNTAQTVGLGKDGTQVTAVPKTGYRFDKWDDDCLTANRTDRNVAKNITATPIFSILTYTLNYGVKDAGTGSISGPATQTMIHYTPGGAEVTASPAAHYHFVSWSDGSTTNPRKDLLVTGDINVTAKFEIDSFSLTYSVEPAATGLLNGSITDSSTNKPVSSPVKVNYGANGPTVTAVANPKCHFVSWSDTITTATRKDSNVTADKTVKAQFAANLYQTISFGNTPTLLYNGTAMLTATAAPGLAVVYATSTPAVCTISGNTITDLKPGTCTITANQAGNAIYYAAPQAQLNIDVEKVGQAIVFDPAPRVPFKGRGNLVAHANTGLPITYESNNNICTVNNAGMVTSVAAGVCSIWAHQAGNEIYKPAVAKQDINIDNTDPYLPNGRYTIRPVHSGKCVEVSSGSKVDKANVQQLSCNGADAQSFDVTNTGDGWYSLKNVNSGKVMDVAGSSLADGANIWQWSDNATDNQRFSAKRVNGSEFKLTNKSSGKCVDVASAGVQDGANIQQYACSDIASQRFKFFPVNMTGSAFPVGRYTIKSVYHNSDYLASDGFSTDNGTTIRTYNTISSAYAKTFDLIPNSGYYNLKSVDSGRLLDVKGASGSNGANIILWDANNGDNQRYSFVDKQNSQFEIHAKHSGKCMDLDLWSAFWGLNNVQQWSCGNSKENQKWMISPIN